MSHFIWVIPVRIVVDHRRLVPVPRHLNSLNNRSSSRRSTLIGWLTRILIGWPFDFCVAWTIRGVEDWKKWVIFITKWLNESLTMSHRLRSHFWNYLIVIGRVFVDNCNCFSNWCISLNYSKTNSQTGMTHRLWVMGHAYESGNPKSLRVRSFDFIILTIWWRQPRLHQPWSHLFQNLFLFVMGRSRDF